MSFISPTYTASKLSEVDVDCDKDWAVKGITSLKQLAVGMAKGNLAYFNGTELVKITPGSVGTELITHDVGFAPTFGYPP